MSRTVSVHVGYVDVELDEIDTDDLQEELVARGKGLLDAPSLDPQLNELYYAFKFGRDDLAMQLARKLVCDATGRIL